MLVAPPLSGLREYVDRVVPVVGVRTAELRGGSNRVAVHRDRLSKLIGALGCAGGQPGRFAVALPAMGGPLVDV